MAKLKGTLLSRHIDIPVKEALKLMTYTTFTRHFFIFRMWLFALSLKPSLGSEIGLKTEAISVLRKKQNLILTCAKFNEHSLGLFEAIIAFVSIKRKLMRWASWC